MKCFHFSMQFQLVLLIIRLLLSSGYENIAKGKKAAHSQNATQCNEILCPTYVATKAVDGQNNTCTLTEIISQKSTSHTLWWYVDLGDIRSIYSIRILFEDYRDQHGETFALRQRGRFDGFSLYVSNTTKKEDGYLCYKDGQDLPPLNFITLCIKHGRYVIYYNERLLDATYTEAATYGQLCEVVVKGCDSTGVYGVNCDLQCPENCQKHRCNIVDGACLGCTPGWTGDFCNQTCPSGLYGLECRFICKGHCYNEQPCNHTTGKCDNGCAPGWKGSECNEECPNGTYGSNCVSNCSVHCFGGVTCNKKTGKCDTGCTAGYTGELCHRVCNSGSFGQNCSKTCANCRRKTCTHVDGRCTDGCGDGYTGSFCNEGCSEGWYGRNCTFQCSEDCFNRSCNRISGKCLECMSARISPYCVKESEQSSDDLELGAVGGSIGAIALVIIVISGLFVIRWRRNKNNNEERETEIFSSSNETFMKDDRKEECEKTELENLTLTTKRNPEKYFSKTVISLLDFEGMISKLCENENTRLKEEYLKIPRGELHPCNEGKKQQNRTKNRYTTILPYDHSRVILNTSNQKESDYINSNFMEDIQGRRTYIATQGPKSNTIVDFWRMVWQENISVIVCLTNLKEGEKKKCAQYWPDPNDKIKKGNISIRSQDERVYANYVIRLFRLQNDSVDWIERELLMFHYTQWPDHGVPEPVSLVIFHRHVMKVSLEYSGEYTLVHCSAGIGRTGTYVALDALYKEGELTGKINVPKYVETMRKDRMNMIQGDDQYKTVYMALFESFRGKSKSISTERFLPEFQEHSCYINLGEVANKSPLSLEFEELLSIRKEYTQEDYKFGKANISANSIPSVLPVDAYLCLLSNTKGKNTYYNAVSVQSFTRNDCFISAQYPLPDYTEDFLRLVKEYYTPIIVSLSPLVEIESSALWFPAKNENKQVGTFTIKSTDCTQLATVNRTNITIQQKGLSSMRVSVLECRRWKGENDSSNRRALIDLIKEAKLEEKTHPDGRILVLSSDGAKRCGPFFAVFNALEQMTMDKEVDIFTITRQLQIRRPEFISSLEEYHLCYDTVADYLQNDTVYANC